MPSFLLDEKNNVVAVMSFDPVNQWQMYLKEYTPEIVNKRWDNGEFVEVEPVQNDGDLVAHDGGALDG
ncbi:hypothetical protein MA794_001657 [Vibrio vulnificus]|nr:hypothetical protein [Vibrio vulnificus]